MASTVVLFVIAAFLSGAVTAVFAMLVVSVHAGDRPRHLTAAPPGRPAGSPHPNRPGRRRTHRRQRGGLTDAPAKQIPGLRCHSGRNPAARHLDAIRLFCPKEWFRRDRNHAPGIPDSDSP